MKAGCRLAPATAPHLRHGPCRSRRPPHQARHRAGCQRGLQHLLDRTRPHPSDRSTSRETPYPKLEQVKLHQPKLARLTPGQLEHVQLELAQLGPAQLQLEPVHLELAQLQPPQLHHHVQPHAVPAWQTPQQPYVVPTSPHFLRSHVVPGMVDKTATHRAWWCARAAWRAAVRYWRWCRHLPATC